jgi:hypothetical protein
MLFRCGNQPKIEILLFSKCIILYTCKSIFQRQVTCNIMLAWPGYNSQCPCDRWVRPMIGRFLTPSMLQRNARVWTKSVLVGSIKARKVTGDRLFVEHRKTKPIARVGIKSATWKRHNVQDVKGKYSLPHLFHVLNYSIWGLPYGYVWKLDTAPAWPIYLETWWFNLWTSRFRGTCSDKPICAMVESKHRHINPAHGEM